MKTLFTCAGSVRGGCGKKHRKPEAAARCLKRDARNCKKQGGYSDRFAYICNQSGVIVSPDHLSAEAVNELIVANTKECL